MPLVLLDTDTLSEILKLKDPVVLKNALNYSQTHGPLTFSAVTRYEVRRGLLQKNAIHQMLRFEAFCQKSVILPVTDLIWDRAAELWAAGATGGHSHNDADLLIAATALENGQILVTGNTSHFSWINGLSLADWRLL